MNEFLEIIDELDDDSEICEICEQPVNICGYLEYVKLDDDLTYRLCINCKDNEQENENVV
ncbi:MAG: hypothetical protein WBP82_09875 [Leuconostoc mesenteroides]